MPSWLVAGKPGPDTIHQRAELIEPSVGIYAVRSGQRRSLLCLHNQGWSRADRSYQRKHAAQQSTTVVLVDNVVVLSASSSLGKGRVPIKGRCRPLPPG